MCRPWRKSLFLLKILVVPQITHNMHIIAYNTQLLGALRGKMLASAPRLLAGIEHYPEAMLMYYAPVGIIPTK